VVAFLEIGLLQWRLGAIRDSRWEGAIANRVRVYGGAGYRAAFGVRRVLALLAFLTSCLTTETRGPNLWRGAARP
jgi:hypothetical protein